MVSSLKYGEHEPQVNGLRRTAQSVGQRQPAADPAPARAQAVLRHGNKRVHRRESEGGHRPPRETRGGRPRREPRRRPAPEVFPHRAQPPPRGERLALPVRHQERLPREHRRRDDLSTTLDRSGDRRRRRGSRGRRGRRRPRHRRAPSRARTRRSLRPRSGTLDGPAVGPRSPLGGDGRTHRGVRRGGRAPLQRRALDAGRPRRQRRGRQPPRRGPPPPPSSRRRSNDSPRKASSSTRAKSGASPSERSPARDELGRRRSASEGTPPLADHPMSRVRPARKSRPK